MKKITNKLLKFILLTSIIFTLLLSGGVSAFAEETSTEEADIVVEEPFTEENKVDEGISDTSQMVEESTNSGLSSLADKSISNIFDEVYSRIETNSDKIFSILAFIGTLVVGIGYKSGLLPLLRDALSRLKASIDLVKEDGDKNNLINREKFSDISNSIEKINESLVKNTDELTRIKWQFEGYEQLCMERESMRLILLNQIDMLYAIFMSSALPQYQKDEIGEKIQSMREELLAYENKEN